MLAQEELFRRNAGPTKKGCSRDSDNENGNKHLKPRFYNKGGGRIRRQSRKKVMAAKKTEL